MEARPRTPASRRRGALPAALLLLLGPGALADGMNGPWEGRSHSRPAPPETRPEILAASTAIRLFQRFVSPVDGPRCHLYPSCSEFSRQAIGRYGLLAGAVLTAGRLLRDNASAHGFYPRRLIRGRIVLYDPPEAHWPWWERNAGSRLLAPESR